MNMTEENIRYRIDRLAQTENDLQKRIGVENKETNSVLTKIKRSAQKSCSCSKGCVLGFFKGLFPIFTWLLHYQEKWLPGDLVSGLTVGVVHIPQSLAFAILAGLAPVFGLYTSFYPVVIYTLMGTSRHISVGTFAVTSLLTRSVVFRYFPPEIVSQSNGTSLEMNSTMVPNFNNTNAERFSELDLQRAGVAASVTLVMGVFQIIFGIFRLGFITSYLSEPLIQGFTTGAACQVVTSQTPTILGIQIGRFNGPFSLIQSWVEIFKSLPRVHVPTLIITILCFIFLIIGREINLRFRERMKVPLPTEVLLVIITILASHFGQFRENFDVVIVDNIPTGLPAPVLPNMSILGDIIADGFALAIVGFAISVSLAKMYGNKHGYSVDPNQELVAYGVSNIIPSFFLCFPNAAALARCEIQDNTGGKTQVVGIISVIIVLISILVLGPVFEPLPRAVLGSIIIVGLFGILLQFRNLKHLYKTSKVDFSVWLVTWLAVVLLGVDVGLLFGVVFAIITVIVRTQIPRFEILINVPGTDIYRAEKTIQQRNNNEGILVVKLYSSLYYANKDMFRSKLIEALGFDPGDVLCQRKEAKERRKIELAKLNENSKGFFGIGKNKDRRQDQVTSGDAQGIPSTSVEISEVETEDAWKSNIHSVIVDCGCFGFTDFVGGKLLKQLCSQFNDIGISFYLAACSVDIREQLQRSGFVDVAGMNSVFPTVHDAALFALKNQR
uniref:pendrin-like n=1 Tax=Styela clava TaxID=7725 RepID=UPI00193970ED|nr:pendrin-like [Styela clava]